MPVGRPTPRSTVRHAPPATPRSTDWLPSAAGSRRWWWVARSPTTIWPQRPTPWRRRWSNSRVLPIPANVPGDVPNLRLHPQDYFATSPVVGYANPVAPPVDVWAVGGTDGQAELRGRAVFDYQYEGPPTCVHGGVIAELFDELLGAVNILAGNPGMTGTLTIRYRKPTPLRTPLDLSARQVRVEGRKIFAEGRIEVDGTLTAEAEGIFIQAFPERMLEIINATRPVVATWSTTS